LTVAHPYGPKPVPLVDIGLENREEGKMALAALVVLAAPMSGDIELLLDQSGIDVEICILDACDSDASSVSGWLHIDFDCLIDPRAIALQDFDVQTDKDLYFHLDYGLRGDIYIYAKGLALYHADPGGQPFFPIVEGRFSLTGVTYLMRGTIEYEATGLICVILQGLEIPCEGTIKLEEYPQGSADMNDGRVEIAEGVVMLSGEMEFDEPLDPQHPDMGRIKGTAVMNASGPMPVVGDLDRDDDVDLGDFAVLQLCFGGSTNPPDPACPPGVNADLDCDDDVDLEDYAILAEMLTGP